MIEDKDIYTSIMNNAPLNDQVVVKIGSENKSSIFSDYSLISKEYKIGDVKGKLGIVGPRRMQYSKVIAIVEYVAEILSEYLKKGNIN